MFKFNQSTSFLVLVDLLNSVSVSGSSIFLFQILVVLHYLLLVVHYLLVVHSLLLHYQWLDCLLEVHAISMLVLVVVLHNQFLHYYHHFHLQDFLHLLDLQDFLHPHIHHSPLLQPNHCPGKFVLVY